MGILDVLRTEWWCHVQVRPARTRSASSSSSLRRGAKPLQRNDHRHPHNIHEHERCIHSQSYLCTLREWHQTTGRTSCGTPERLRPSFHLPHNATAQYSTYRRPRSTLVQATGKVAQHDWVRVAFLSMGTRVTTDASHTHARGPSLRFGPSRFRSSCFWCSRVRW